MQPPPPGALAVPNFPLTTIAAYLALGVLLLTTFVSVPDFPKLLGAALTGIWTVGATLIFWGNSQ
jgi:hypothetical protein